MAILVSSQNLVTLFIGFELLSIPLYVLCASEFRREASLESGLKYLVIGSVGSATLVYGLAMVYGATGSTDFSGIARAISSGSLAGGVLGDPLLLTGFALVLVGFAFKASVAPFHQWTPDVYEGAPTPVTAFMATATKAAALGVFIRFFDVAAIADQNDWAPAIATIAAITIIVGNVGALGQSSLKRMLGYSGVAQAGYMLGGVVVGTQLGVQATVLYLGVYLFMNLAAFAVIVAQEDELAGPEDDEDAPSGDDISSLAGLGARKPWLAWPMTIAMLSLAGIPATVGFIGKFQLIHALVNGDYTWLAIVLVIGSMISLGYYLRVVAAMWMRPGAVARVGTPAMAGAAAGAAAGGGALPPIAGASGEAEPGATEAGGAAAAGGAAGLAAFRRVGGAAGGRPRRRRVQRRERVLWDLPLAAVQSRRPRRARAAGIFARRSRCGQPRPARQAAPGTARARQPGCVEGQPSNADVPTLGGLDQCPVNVAGAGTVRARRSSERLDDGSGRRREGSQATGHPQTPAEGGSGPADGGATIRRPWITRSRASPRRNRNACVRISPISTGRCSRSSTFRRRSRGRCSRGIRAIRGRSGGCSSTSSPMTSAACRSAPTATRASGRRSCTSGSSSATEMTRSRSSAAPTSPASGSPTC